MVEKIIKIDNAHLGNVFGSFDKNVKAIEKQYEVRIANRGEEIKVIGEEKAVDQVIKVLYGLYEIAKKGEHISDQNVNYLLSLVEEKKENKLAEIMDGFVAITAKGKQIRCKTLGQKKYVQTIRKNTIVFGIGPAGTGKTYLAMAMAITAFKNNEVTRIVLTRPAIEAGEKLGFLPGDLQSKVDPYLRPLYDALHEIMGPETYLRYMEKGMIEVAPLAYMRGRTIDNSFIIMDEAQNTTPEQMKMFLTRIGFGSKVVITGDVTQVDLPTGKKSGLSHVEKILKGIDGIEFVYLTSKDVVRHELVQKIIDAYDIYDKGGQQS